ncbi:MAG: hypothetical protein H0U03_11290 [Actinobacteria bacterium]|nr:hypothetical protein [Actinomycetota bacterium]
MEMTADQVAARLDDPTLVILDVRTPGEYAGAAGYPCDPRQGHIPGAVHVAVDELLGRSPDEVRAATGIAEGTEVVTYCHSGQRSAMAAEALRAAGYSVWNYPGSWHEWSRRTDLSAEV